MSRQFSKNSIGSTKHGKSGIPPRNRRALRIECMKINKEACKLIKRKKVAMYGSVLELVNKSKIDSN